VEVRHQLDHDVGFNLLPDYAGGGISAEHRDLQAAVRERLVPPMHFGVAEGVERSFSSAYRAPGPLGAGARRPAAIAAAPGRRRRRHRARFGELPEDALGAALKGGPSGHGTVILPAGAVAAALAPAGRRRRSA